MKRFISGAALLALLLAGMLGANAIGQGGDKAEAVKLDSLKSELLQKMVQQHLDSVYARDKAKAAQVKALADVLGGTAGVPGRLRYEWKDKKPVVTFATTGLQEPAAADRDRAIAALRDLVGSALAKAAASGYEERGKKYTLTAQDAQALREGVRLAFAQAAPAAADPVKQLQARLDAMTKELAAMKTLEARLAAAEKAVKDTDGLKKISDDVGKQGKELEGLKKTLEGVGKQVKDLEPLKKSVEDLGKQVKQFDTLKKSGESLGKQVKELDGLKKSVESLDRQMKGLPERLDKVEAAAKNLDTTVKKVEAGLKLVEAAAKKLEVLPVQMKNLESRLERLEKTLSGLSKGSDERIKKLEAQLKAEQEERSAAIKKLEEELKKFTTPQIVPTPLPTAPIILPPHQGVPCPQPIRIRGRWFPCSYNILVPAVGTGYFGEQFPVLRLADMGAWGQGYGYGYGYEYGNGPVTEEKEKKAGDKKDADKKDKTIEKPKKDSTGDDDAEGPALMQFMSRGGSVPARDALPREVTISGKLNRSRKTIDLRGLSAKDAEPLFWKGYRLYWENKVEEANAHFEAATELFEDDARFWYYRSLTESVLGQKRAAEASLNQAVDLHQRGLPQAELISRSLERVQGEPRMRLRDALDARRSAR